MLLASNPARKDNPIHTWTEEAMALRRIGGLSMAAFLALAFLPGQGTKAWAQRAGETVSDDSSGAQEQTFQQRRGRSRDTSDDSSTDDKGKDATSFGARLFGGWGFGLISDNWT